MTLSGDRWRGVLPAWSGIAVACGAAIVIELLLMERGLALTIAGTVLVGLVSGILVTRKIMARNQQPLITVQDLRRR